MVVLVLLGLTFEYCVRYWCLENGAVLKAKTVGAFKDLQV